MTKSILSSIIILILSGFLSAADINQKFVDTARNNSQNRLPILKKLLEAKANIDTISKEDGWSALMLRCMVGDYESIQWLVNSKASIHIKESLTKRTALNYAAQSGDVRIVQLLIDAGADPLARSLKDSFSTEELLPSQNILPSSLNFKTMKKTIEEHEKDALSINIGFLRRTFKEDEYKTN